MTKTSINGEFVTVYNAEGAFCIVKATDLNKHLTCLFVCAGLPKEEDLVSFLQLKSLNKCYLLNLNSLGINSYGYVQSGVGICFLNKKVSDSYLEILDDIGVSSISVLQAQSIKHMDPAPLVYLV